MPEPVDQLAARIAKLLRARRELDRRLTEYQDDLREAIGEPEDIHDWMRRETKRIGRYGKLGVAAAALFVVRRPLKTAIMLAVIGGGAVTWYLAPWANGEEQPGALPARPPAATRTADPTPTRTAAPTATPSPAGTPAGTPEPAPTDEEPGQPVTAAGREQDRQPRRGRPGDRPPEFPPDRDERDCAVPVRIDVPDLVEVGVCVSPLLG